jgi:hypothetical protein
VSSSANFQDTVDNARISAVEDSKVMPTPKHSQLAKRLWASRREKVLGALQEEQAAMVADPTRAEAARLYAEAPEATVRSPWKAGRIDISEDYVSLKEDRSFRDPYLDEPSYKEALGQEAQSPLTAMTYFLFDPKLTASEMDRQLVVLLDEVCISSELAKVDLLRSYDDPIHGAAIATYLKERLTHRIDVYEQTSMRSSSALSYAWPAVLNRLRDRSLYESKVARIRIADRLFANKAELSRHRASVKGTTSILAANANTQCSIISRNALYANEYGSTSYTKSRAHAVHDLWSTIESLSRTSWEFPKEYHAVISGSRLVKSISRFAQEVRDAKTVLKTFNFLPERTGAAAVAELRNFKQITHRYYTESRSVDVELMNLNKLYYQAHKWHGLNYEQQRSKVKELILLSSYSELPRSIAVLIRCITLMQAARISKKYNYQTWPKSAVRPILPDFVQEAVKKHRQKYGSQSIF